MLIALSAAGTARANDANDFMILEPSSDWVLDYAEERCSLTRPFGEGDDVVRFQIDSFGSHHNYRVLVAGDPISIGRTAQGKIRYRLTPDAELRPEVDALQGKYGTAAAIAFSTAFGPPVDGEVIEKLTPDEFIVFFQDFVFGLPAYHGKVDALDLNMQGARTVRFELGAMNAPLAALEACVDDLYAHWGFDSAQQRALKRPPVPKPSTVRKIQRRYPSDMLLEGVTAFVPVRVEVAANGRTVNCVVQIETVDEAFKDAVCAGLARGFEPALDAECNPVRAIYHGSAIYI